MKMATVNGDVDTHSLVSLIYRYSQERLSAVLPRAHFRTSRMNVVSLTNWSNVVMKILSGSSNMVWFLAYFISSIWNYVIWRYGSISTGTGGSSFHRVPHIRLRQFSSATIALGPRGYRTYGQLEFIFLVAWNFYIPSGKCTETWSRLTVQTFRMKDNNCSSPLSPTRQSMEIDWFWNQRRGDIQTSFYDQWSTRDPKLSRARGPNRQAIFE